MGRFVIGLFFGLLIGGLGLSALAILNPRNGAPDAPGQVAQAPEATPEPEAEPEPEPAPAPEPEPAPEPAPEPEPEPEPAPTTEVAAAPSVGEAAPAISLGGGEPAAPDAPALGSPEISSGSDAGLSQTTDQSPVRTAAAPQQVETGSTDTGSAPAVNTESAGVPEVGDAALEAAPDAEGQATGLAPQPLVEGNALVANAADFNGDQSKPLMSIILIDDGTNQSLRSGLLSLSSPITFGVSADVADAGDVAIQYRNNGYEVVAVLPSNGESGLSEATDPDAVSGLIGAVTAAIPVASTIMDVTASPVVKNRKLTDAVIAAAKVTGHGVLTYRGSGLNNVPQLAAEQGVASDVVYRVIDEDGGSANIALSLERAVLDASRGGHVIVVGRVQAETVTTLFSWLLGSGAKAVTIAPVSTILRNQAG